MSRKELSNSKSEFWVMLWVVIFTIVALGLTYKGVADVHKEQQRRAAQAQDAALLYTEQQ